MGVLKKNSYRFHRSQVSPGSAARRWLWRYVTLGLISLVWLGLRSGSNPRRLAYPCQQAAAANGLGFLTYAVTLISSARAYRYVRNHLTPGRLILLITSFMLVVVLSGERFNSSLLVWASPVLPAWTSPNAVSDVFAVTNVPTPAVSLDGGVIPGGVSPAEALHDDGMDTLINLMANRPG
jgi:hypothetical protein